MSVNTSNRARKLCSIIAAVAVVPAFLIVLGALVPAIPVLGNIGTVLESFLTLHIVLLASLATVFAWFAVARWAGRFTRVIAILGVAVVAGSLVALVRLAHQTGAPLSWALHLRVVPGGPALVPDETGLYASPEGKPLHADIYRPRQSGLGGRSTPVVMMHGGGFVVGQRGGGTLDWDRWFIMRGYTVFDIDYRLSPPVTWNQAAPDVACALTWIAAHADQYQIAAERVLLAGQSAGGGLAMQVAYGLADGTVKSSCGGVAVQPRAVIALHPPDDLAVPWRLDTGMGPISARKFNTAYLGGSPEQFPERYRTVSPVFHIRPDSAPTLIGAGEHDHLVPLAGHIDARDRMIKAGVPNVLIVVPYSDHGYDAAWGSLGSQITQHVAAEFLENYSPAHAGPN